MFETVFALGKSLILVSILLAVQLKLDQAIISTWNGSEHKLASYTVTLESTSTLSRESASLYHAARDTVIGYKVCLAFTAVFYGGMF
nr:hypothetical protein BaRGS_016862 [Batillaria attramentaria]